MIENVIGFIIGCAFALLGSRAVGYLYCKYNS